MHRLFSIMQHLLQKKLEDSKKKERQYIAELPLISFLTSSEVLSNVLTTFKQIDPNAPSDTPFFDVSEFMEYYVPHQPALSSPLSHSSAFPTNRNMYSKIPYVTTMYLYSLYFILTDLCLAFRMIQQDEDYHVSGDITDLSSLNYFYLVSESIHYKCSYKLVKLYNTRIA